MERKIGKESILCIYKICPISQPRAFFFLSPWPTEIIIRVTVSIFRETVSRSRGQIRASRRRAKRLNLWKSHREGTAGKKEEQKTRRFLPPRRKRTSIYEHRPTTSSWIQEFLDPSSHTKIREFEGLLLFPLIEGENRKERRRTSKFHFPFCITCYFRFYF